MRSFAVLVGLAAVASAAAYPQHPTDVTGPYDGPSQHHPEPAGPYDHPEEPEHDEPYNGEPEHDEPYNGEPEHDEPYNGEPEHDEPYNGEPEHDEPYHDEPKPEEPYHEKPEEPYHEKPEEPYHEEHTEPYETTKVYHGLSTYCPEPTVITYGYKTYTATCATTIVDDKCTWTSTYMVTPTPCVTPVAPTTPCPSPVAPETNYPVAPTQAKPSAPAEFTGAASHAGVAIGALAGALAAFL